MLLLHMFFVLSLFELKFPQMVFSHPQLFVKLVYLRIILAFFVKLFESFLLLALDLQQRFRLFLELRQNPFFVFLFVFKCDDLLYVV